MISRAILQTLRYSDHFGFPLTVDEIYFRLVGEGSSRPLLIRNINKLLKSNLIQKTDVYYHLPGRSSLVARRLKHAQLSPPQLTRARHLSSILYSVPSILAIYLTGSLAVCNSSAASDIDLMIITKNNRLWTTRLLLTLYTSLLGLRRTPTSTKNTGKLCLNLYLTPKTYHLPPSKQSLYTAYELIQSIPLYDPHNTHSALLAANPWITNFLPNYPLPAHQARERLRNASRHGVVWETNFPLPQTTPSFIDFTTLRLYDYLENLLYHLQLAYMRPRLTRELITPDSAFFHPHDPSKKVLSKISLVK